MKVLYFVKVYLLYWFRYFVSSGAWGYEISTEWAVLILHTKGTSESITKENIPMAGYF